MSDTPLTDAASFWHREAPAHVPLGGRVVAESVAQSLERQASRWQAVAQKLAETSRNKIVANHCFDAARRSYLTNHSAATSREYDMALDALTAAQDAHDSALTEYDSLTGAGAEKEL